MRAGWLTDRAPLRTSTALCSSIFRPEIEKLLTQSGDVKHTYADISRMKAMLDWQPEMPIEEGLQVFADWVTDYYADRPVLEV